MAKTETKNTGGRRSRTTKLKDLSRRIAAVKDGSYLAGLQQEYRVLDLQEAMSEARGVMGTGGVRMVDAMLKKAAGNEAALDRLREYLGAAGLKAKLIDRIVGSPTESPAAAVSKPKKAPKREAKVEPPADIESLLADLEASESDELPVSDLSFFED